MKVKSIFTIMSVGLSIVCFSQKTVLKEAAGLSFKLSKATLKSEKVDTSNKPKADTTSVPKADTTVKKDSTNSKEKAAGDAVDCEIDFTKLDVKFQKLDDGDYMFSFIEHASKEVKESFTFRRFNKAFFRDLLKKSVQRMCASVDFADSLVDASISSETNNLYERILEASLEVEDESPASGVLNFNKKVPIYIDVDIRDKEAYFINIKFHTKKVKKMR